MKKVISFISRRYFRSNYFEDKFGTIFHVFHLPIEPPGRGPDSVAVAREIYKPQLLDSEQETVNTPKARFTEMISVFFHICVLLLGVILVGKLAYDLIFQDIINEDVRGLFIVVAAYVSGRLSVKVG